MLHLIPAPLHRLVLRLAHGIRRRWWRWCRPHVEGCRVLAIDDRGRILLVRHSYVPDAWTPPDGGLRRGESALAAARRELAEETACGLGRARPMACQVEHIHGTSHQVHVVAGRALGEPRADGREVIEARFFPLDALPGSLSGKLSHDIRRWVAVYNSES